MKVYAFAFGSLSVSIAVTNTLFGSSVRVKKGVLLNETRKEV